MDNNRLNQLFDEAKLQAPKASFDKTKNRFINSINSGAKPSHSNHFFKTNLFKTLLMITSSIAIVGISLFIWNKAPEEKEKSINNNHLTVESIEKVNNIQPNQITSKPEKNLYIPEKITTPIIFLNTEKDKATKTVSRTPLTTVVSSVNENEVYQFPNLTEEEIVANHKQKKSMLKRLAKLDKKTYAFIPSGKYDGKSVNAFYMQTTEVSVLEYRTFLFDLLIQNRKDEFLKAKPDQTQWTKIMGAYTQPLTDHYFSHPAYNNYPVNNISREGAMMYCDWLNRELIKSGYLKKNESLNEARLPSEYEWMYAASGGKNRTPYPWGGPYVRNALGCYLANFKPGKDTSLTCDSWNKLKNVTNNDSMTNFVQTMDDARLPKINENPYSDDGGLFTVQVSSYNPNDFGLYCMSGNIAEMVFEEDTKQPITKGGSWMSPMHEMQINAEGTHQGETGPMVDVGFRIAIPHLVKSENEFKPIGMVKIKEGLYMDEGEISNFQYREFLNWLLKNEGAESSAYLNNLPDTTIWSENLKYHTPYDSFYFSHPAYNNYPIVGITYEQAQAFCKWRTQYLNDHSTNQTKLEYRLPTKEEFESIATIGYSEKTKDEIKDEEAYQLSNFKRTKEELKNTTDVDITAPVKSYYPNAYGVYNLKGNVAEMTSTKGIAKGGSWIHTEQESTFEKDFTYQKPSSWLGFRTILEVKNAE